MKSAITLTFLFLVLGVVTPIAFAGDVGIAQLSGCTGLDCSACNVVDMANGLITWLIGILFVVFALLLAIAGVRLVTSGGNHHALDEAKSSFMNAIIGFIIILSAWLIVDTIMRGLVGTSSNPGQIRAQGSVTGWLFWTEVQCQEQEDTPFTEVEQEEVEWIQFTPQDNVFNNPTAIGTVSPGGIYYPTSNVSADNSLSYQSGIAAQRPHASAALESLLRCMGGRLPGNVGQISSISDSRIVNGSKTFAQCWEGGCAHTAGSCHYGNGYGVIGKSYAADFGDENNASDIIGAAYTCGAKAAAVHNGNHVHVTAQGCRGI
jgi:Type IV secretion system pilin